MRLLSKIKGYLHNDAVALDVGVNVIAGGKMDETISSRAQRAADRGNLVGRVLTGFLYLFQKDHGHKAEAGDLRRAEQVEEIEKKALGKSDE